MGKLIQCKKLLLACFCLLYMPFAWAQQIIRGVIKDAQGEPLVGANVVEKGTVNGTVTDLEGRYVIQPEKAGAVLVVSFIGYISQELAPQDNMEVVLQEDAKSLEEVVVVGYQTIRKSDLTGAVSSVKAKELNLTTPSVGQSLVGKVAGVQISQVSGAPYQSTKIRVRGVVSVNAGSDPLYVIDGYPSNEDVFISPEDIESIEILKDAASAAIYGSRAAGGVVMITTRRGKEGRAKVDVNYQHTVGRLSHKVDMLNSREFAEVMVDARNNTYRDLLVNGGKTWSDAMKGDSNAERAVKLGSNNSGAMIPDFLYDFASQTVKTPQYDTDWQDELYQNAQGDRLHVNISGGRNGLRYNVSGAYQAMDGIIKSTMQDRLNLRSNIDADVNEKFRVGANLSLTTNANREVREGRFDKGPILGALVYAPIFRCYDENGNLAKNEMASYANAYGFQSIENPVALATETIIKRNGLRNSYNVFGIYDIAEGFYAKANLGMYNYTEDYDFYLPTSLSSGVNPPYSTQAKAAAYSVSRHTVQKDYLGELTLNYSKSVGNHNFQGIVGGSLQKNMLDVLEAMGTGYSDDHITEITGHGTTAGDVTLTNATGKSNWTMASYFARVNYNLLGRYFLSASFRGDGSSLFGTLNRWGYFPSVSAGWTISNEDFYRNAFGAGSTLKLRSSWGLSGNNGIGYYKYAQVMSSPTGVVIGNAVGSAMYPGAFADRKLGWESTSQFNIGLDWSLFDNRVSIITNFYNSNTFNLLFDQSISAISGSTNYLTNLPDSKIRNRGVDIQVDGYVVNSEDFSLKVGGNIAVNRNKVMDMGGASTIITAGAERSYKTHITQEGSPIGMFHGFKVAGMVRESDMANLAEDDLHYNASANTFPDGYKIKGPARSTAQTTKLLPGDIYFEDKNGDGVVTDDDKDIIGSPHPDFIYGIHIAANYKSFDLMASFNGVQGNEVLDGQDYYIYNMEGSGNLYQDVAQRYRDEQNPGNGKVYRAARGGTQSNSTRLSSFYLQDGSFFRCTNITAGYSFATGGAISSLRLYVAVDNAFTLTEYKGYNPEVDYNDGNSLTPGVDYGKYPLVRAFNVGAQLSF